jgi:hypothetical protein
VDNEGPGWDVPYPYGQAAAIDSMGGIAAPLLAGFSVTLALLVISTPQAFRFVNATLALLLVAAFALIAALQFTFRARQYAVSPSQIVEWWPDAESDERLQELRHEQREHRKEFTRWANPARYAYNVGILCFVLVAWRGKTKPHSGQRGRSRPGALCSSLSRRFGFFGSSVMRIAP